MDISSKIKTLAQQIDRNETREAIDELQRLTEQYPQNDQLFYLLGNAYRKQANWQMAINNYLEALDINPDSPAGEAKDMLVDILEFYNKDMYNH